MTKLQTGEISEELEEEYLQNIKQVKKPEKFPQAMEVLVDGLEERAYDFLGCVLGEWGILSKWAGQFFTPESLTTSMASMTLGDRKPEPSHRLTLCEPACGAGAMTIAASEVLKNQGFYPFHYYWTCVDIDHKMFEACYIQLTLLGIPAVVINGNTLSLETWDAAYTFAAAVHPMRYARSQDDPSETPTLEHLDVPHVQKTLF